MLNTSRNYHVTGQLEAVKLCCGHTRDVLVNKRVESLSSAMAVQSDECIGG